jgi:3-(3-hydroxy-phenyl)propionate hydroxylase
VRGLNSGLDDAGNLAWKLALVQQGHAGDSLLDGYSSERVLAARENIAFGAKSTEFMAPPHHGFALLRAAALRLALVAPGVRSLINPRQTSPVEYVNSPLNQPDQGSAFTGGARAGMPGPEARLRTVQGSGHLTALYGSEFVALYFSNDPRLPDRVQRLAAGSPVLAASSAVAALRLVRVSAKGVPDSRTVVDDLGQAWQRYGAMEGTLYLIRPDGYVMGRWREAASARIDIARVLERTLKDPP